ncbi:MAG: hypothetical protein ACLGJB_00825 [Blastocatellia bacterium]
MSARPLRELPTVLTCFAFREEYFPELDGMLATVKRHHPDWPVVVGRGAPSADGVATLDVESPSGRCHWTLPVPLHLGGGEDDWRKITRMKSWWLEEVWRQFGGLANTLCNRMMWLDADARLNAPLGFELDPGVETIAGPWWYDPNDSRHDTITSGMLLFQGAEHGPMADILRLWRQSCLEEIENLAASTVPWADGDQEVLSRVLTQSARAGLSFHILKLDHDEYVGIPSDKGEPRPGALVDHWMMSAKMGRKGKRGEDWPPPEHLRRIHRDDDKERSEIN